MSPGFSEAYLLDPTRFSSELTEYRRYIKDMVELVGASKQTSSEFSDEILNISTEIAKVNKYYFFFLITKIMLKINFVESNLQDVLIFFFIDYDCARTKEKWKSSFTRCVDQRAPAINGSSCPTSELLLIYLIILKRNVYKLYLIINLIKLQNFY